MLEIRKLFPNLASGLRWKQTWLSVGFGGKNNNFDCELILFTDKMTCVSLSPFSPSGKPDHRSRSSSPARTICFIAEPRRWLAPPQPFPPSLPVLSSQPKFQKLEIIYGAGGLYRQTSLQAGLARPSRGSLGAPPASVTHGWLWPDPPGSLPFAPI
ncbi:hypothetical protein FH972_009123 [Carpinus fangiana]|uniref:Uncharacterized protein n=1 Tax=Carpinus fangiana TaxID=176857 RepID=A0A5N6R3Z9_9ROSI|nr:hypothetical protein FH972_009123 [Carpinus fangiana]